MAYCTQCGKPLTPGTKFCTNCGTKVPIGVATTSPTAQKTVAPPPPVAPEPTPPQPPTPQVTTKVARTASAAASMAKVLDIQASNQKGEWVAANWDMPALATTSPTSLMANIKNFFIPQRKLAYAWFLLPVLTTAITIISYIFHLIGKLFS